MERIRNKDDFSLSSPEDSILLAAALKRVAESTVKAYEGDKGQGYVSWVGFNIVRLPEDDRYFAWELVLHLKALTEEFKESPEDAPCVKVVIDKIYKTLQSVQGKKVAPIVIPNEPGPPEILQVPVPNSKFSFLFAFDVQ